MTKQTGRARKQAIRTLLLAVLACMCIAPPTVNGAQSAAPEKGPAPGRLIDAGGFRLHLNCVGHGTPTVVFDTGAGSWSLHWTHVQRQLSEAGATVCTYDRAGLGWSEESPAPRRTSRMVDELHLLLHNAGITPPVLLVGHSLGAWNVRAYQARYPEEVAGLVLLDGAHEAQWQRLPAVAWQLTRASVSGTRARAEEARAGKIAVDGIARAGFLKFVPDVRDAYVAAMLDPRTYVTIAAETESAGESAKDVPPSTPGSLGDLPIVVLTARNSFAAFANTPIPREESNAIWLDLQRELAALSRDGLQLFSERGHHRLQESDPEAVVGAVRRGLEMVRRRPALPSALGLPATLLPATSSPEVDRLLSNLEASYRAKDVDRFVALFTDDFTQLDVNRRVHVRGKATWADWTKRINDAHTVMDRVHRGRVSVGEWVIVEVEWSGTVRGEALKAAAPRSYRYTGLGLLRLRDGKIRQQILYGDFATFSEQLTGVPVGVR